MATVDLENVKKRFGRSEVIRGVDIAIDDGEFIVIVGPSGCGKSTLLRMVAGLESVSEGEIRIGGRRVNEVEPMDRDIAMVFQNYALYPHMSVRQNISYGLKVAGLPKDRIETKVQEAAELLQLSQYLDRKPKSLSGGQRQRVAMGRAIVREPAVFLFDEPLSNLDAKLRAQMRIEIRELQAKLGVTSLYVTHDQVEAMTMADRMMVMNEGRAEQIGTPLEVYERPQTLFAAQFIGSPSMNVLDAQADGGRVTFSNGASLPISNTCSGPAKVGLRPEHMVSDPSGSLEIEVHFSEPLGATTLLHGTLAGTKEALVCSVPGLHRIADNGAKINVDVAQGNIHLFEPRNGKRID